jgi:hypothetical protein
MMTMTLALLTVAGDVDLAKTGIPWVEGLEAARGQGKPILLFQLLGRLDDTYC